MNDTCPNCKKLTDENASLKQQVETLTKNLAASQDHAECFRAHAAEAHQKLATISTSTTTLTGQGGILEAK